jgi:hypothetical protein
LLSSEIIGEIKNFHDKCKLKQVEKEEVLSNSSYKAGITLLPKPDENTTTTTTTKTVD